MEKRFFVISEGEKYYEGYCNPDKRWNGWARPYFNKEVTDAILKDICDQYTTVKYDESTDTYTITYDDDATEQITGTKVDVNGIEHHLYPVGDGWTWDDCTHEEIQNIDEKNIVFINEEKTINKLVERTVKINGKANIERIVVSDPSYSERVWCRYEQDNIKGNNWNVVGFVNDVVEVIDELKCEGIEFVVMLSAPNEHTELHRDGSFAYCSQNTIKAYEIGMDTACVGIGANKQADEIKDCIDEWQPTNCLKTLTDGMFGNVREGSFKGEVKFICIGGYLDKDTGYTTQDIIQYLVSSLDVELEKCVDITKPLTRKYILQTLKEGNLWKEGEADSITYGEWELTLRKEEEQYNPYMFSVRGNRQNSNETISRRYTSVERAFLHILNDFNENRNYKNKYQNIYEALNDLPNEIEQDEPDICDD